MTATNLQAAAQADADTPRTLRLALLQATGVLLVTRAPQAAARPAPGQPGAASDYVPALPDIFIALRDSGEVLAFNGHVDLGTGIRTALAQIVAEELDVPLERVRMVLGHTEATPNQGPTIASASIQISALPLRRAAAQARAWLQARAAQHLGVEAGGLEAEDGVFRVPGTQASVGYGALLAGEHLELPLADDIPTKPVESYRIVGRAAGRVDIPGKVRGALTFVHDVRVPGMLHGRVVRPPYAGRDSGHFVGNSLLEVDRDSVRDVPGVVDVVVQGDFVGVVAEREEYAVQAARRLRVRWKPIPPLPALDDPEPALRANPATRRELLADGELPANGAGMALQRRFVWPYQMHGSIGPSCAVADWHDDGLTVWSGTQNPHVLRIDLAKLCGLGEDRIEIVRMEAAGCYGRNCADDVGADAALLSRAVGRPVRVQLSREQEHLWEPKGAAQLMDVSATLGPDGALLGYDFTSRYPSNDAPTLALVLTGAVPNAPRTLEMGDRTAVPPYAYGARRIGCDDTPAIVRASWLRGVSALPNAFAHECVIDELAAEAGADPVDFRLRHLPDERAAALLRAVAEAAGWQRGVAGSRGIADAEGWLRGRGVAYARYIHSRFPGFGAAWSAWVVDLAVDAGSGRITIEKVVVGQDTGMMVNPDGVRHQIHGNVVQTLSRVLKEQVRFDAEGVASREWGSYPLLTFPEVPPIEVVLMPRQSEPPLGAGESASLPGAPAIANALFDALGVRLRRPPFVPETVLAGLQAR
ncbi:isoquinoline 1-oxidoreductase subunit beta [Cupriavidus necator N-1]|uniref:Isoquinoline 1-oxidoreductase subunit beta n=1 Tax=Cupriavidus necator (strain ATCC 43291 / DSM 13513 / CCUG 52238 / LMG 8453 / N-1) TaxID=1042878 RepID=G0EYX5_CUPNN|nr:molybdopterin cofactor-binding domain-containing protein [Cupriavidus necator]AEI76240.1 isoquinoline 1-oxidoreductase subunit beta [Cupriavidus necator N-1]MDX6011636.1 molybdopterin cofactor-binding domain-containing protein [Cupriavidus necator]